MVDVRDDGDIPQLLNHLKIQAGDKGGSLYGGNVKPPADGLKGA
jgi:hypothetical protein